MIEVLAPGDEEVLSQDALAFVERLHQELNPTREALLARRAERMGERPGFLAETAGVRDRTGPSRRLLPTSTTGGWRSPVRSTAR